jgi:1-acyl-sn-glycerol-3-phosphate acyltransferase
LKRSRIRDLVVVLIARIVMVVVRLRFQVRVVGNLLPNGAVAVSTHRSYWDGPVVAVLHSSVVPVTSKHFRSTPGVAWFLRHYGVIWTGGDVVTEGVDVVRGGGICWIAPFGLVRDGLDPACGRPGAARIALAADCPVFGIHFDREKRTFRSRLTIRVTEPLWPRKDDDPSELTDRLVRELLQVLPSAHGDEQP